jgi:hypothetical protein
VATGASVVSDGVPMVERASLTVLPSEADAKVAVIQPLIDPLLDRGLGVVFCTMGSLPW